MYIEIMIYSTQNRYQTNGREVGELAEAAHSQATTRENTPEYAVDPLA